MGIELNGKVAIVTGAARGIGKGMATALLKAGAAVTITDVRKDTLAATSAEFDQIPGAKHLALIADGCKDEDVNEAVRKTVEAFGRIDMVINNAQTSETGVNLEDQSVADVMNAIDSGFLASFRYMKAAFPYLKESQGTVVNFASQAGLLGNWGMVGYNAAKEANRALSRTGARGGPAQHHGQHHHPGHAHRGLQGVLRGQPRTLQALHGEHPPRPPGRPREGCRCPGGVLGLRWGPLHHR